MLTTVSEIDSVQSDNLSHEYTLMIYDITHGKHKILCEATCTKRCHADYVFRIFGFKQKAPLFVNGIIGLKRILYHNVR